MGFSNAIYKYPKFKDTTLNQIFNMEDYFSYDSSEWAKKNFASATEYMNYNNGCDTTNYIAPTEEQLNYYKSFLHEDEFSHTVIHDYVYENCSAGTQFHEDICKALDKDAFNNIELTKENIITLLVYEVRKLRNYELESAYIDNCFTLVDDDNEDSDVILKKCDGVEITFEDDQLSKRLETNSKFAEWGTLIMVPRNYIDEYEYNTQFDLVLSLADILENTDFEKECLVYSGGW